MRSRIRPAVTSVTIPSSPRPTSMRTRPVPGLPSCRGTTSSTIPALRVGSPISLAAPTPQARPISSATSASSRSPMVGRVTTAISAPVAALSRWARSVIRASAAWSTMPAASVT